MIEPKSVDQFNSMSKIHKTEWVNYETALHFAKSGILFYPKYNFAIYYEREGREIANMIGETIEQVHKRISCYDDFYDFLNEDN